MRRMSFKLLIPAAVLSALVMLNPAALAVGLGPVEVETHLNEPLRAEIPLRSVGSIDIDEIEVSLASAEEFARVGIERPGVLTRLSFEVERSSRGPVVRVTSEEPIAEPFISFLVRLSWPQGRLLREYTVLLDPPVTAPAAAPQPAQAPRQTVDRDRPEESAPTGREETTAGAPSDSVDRDSRPGGAAPSTGGRYGPVASGETLWEIANRARPDASVSVNQMMLALLRTNPDAFFRDNINALRQGAVLRIPGRDQLQRMSADEAVAAVERQHDLWQDHRRQLADEAPTVVAGGESQERAPTEQPAAEEESRLDLVPPREGESESGDAAAGPGETNAEADAQALREELSRTREELLARTEQSERQDERVDELENQVERLQRLLDLKNEELAAIQAEASDGSEREAAGFDPEAAGDDSGASEAGEEPEETEGASLAEDAGAADGETMDAAPPGEEAQEAAAETGEAAEGPTEEDPTEEEPETAAPPPPSGGGWMELLLSPVVLGIAGLFLIGIGVALFLHRRGGREAQPTLQREPLGSTIGRGREPEDEPRDTAEPGPEETDFGPPEPGPADYDEAALRAALDENPEDTETRLKLIRHYAAAGDRESFIAHAESLYGDLADPASPEWLETRELGEEIAPDHALFGGSGEDVRSAVTGEDDTITAPAGEGPESEESEGQAPPADREAGETRPMGAAEEPADSGAGDDDLPDLDFETPAPEPPEESRSGETPKDEYESAKPAGEEAAGEDREFDLSGLDLGDDEESPAGAGPETESGPEDRGSEEGFDLGDTVESRDTEEQEPLEFDLSDFETDTGSDREGESGAEDWMTETPAEPETPEKPESGATESGGDETVPDLGTGPEEVGGEEPEAGGDDAVDTKLELAEAYLDMSDEEGAREMLEEVLNEGDEGQQKRAREMLDKLS